MFDVNVSGLSFPLPVICSPLCLNGGTCVLPNNTCLCIVDVWTGSQCQTRESRRGQRCRRDRSTLNLNLAVRILWTFDNNLLDFYGNFPGTPINNPSYSFPGINGYGSCLYLNISASQSVNVGTPPFLNMALTSFSLSAWVRANSFRTGSSNCGDNAIFGQFDQNSNDRSLHIVVRNQKSYFGFYGNDTAGNQLLQPAVWYHVSTFLFSHFEMRIRFLVGLRL